MVACPSELVPDWVNVVKNERVVLPNETRSIPATETTLVPQRIVLPEAQL